MTEMVKDGQAVIEAKDQVDGTDEHIETPEDGKVTEQNTAVDKSAEEGASDEATTKDKADKPVELDKDTWGDTGDDVGNAVLQELQESGITTEKAKALLYDAVQKGDPSMIDHDALVEAVGKTRAKLIEVGVKDYIGRQQAFVKETVSTLHEAAGGDSNWKVVAEWAKSGGVPEKKLNELRGMIDKGGESAAFAAQRIVSLYNADSKNTTLGGKTERPGPKTGAPEATPLTAAQYAVELKTLMATGKATEAQRRALLARRQAGKKAFGR